jgi:hypothetical protein
MRQKTKEEFDISFVTDCPLMDRSEEEAVGRATIKKKCCKYWLNTIDIKYSRRMLQNLIFFY